MPVSSEGPRRKEMVRAGIEHESRKMSGIRKGESDFIEYEFGSSVRMNHAAVSQLLL